MTRGPGEARTPTLYFTRCCIPLPYIAALVRFMENCVKGLDIFVFFGIWFSRVSTLLARAQRSARARYRQRHVILHMHATRVHGGL